YNMGSPRPCMRRNSSARTAGSSSMAATAIHKNSLLDANPPLFFSLVALIFASVATGKRGAEDQVFFSNDSYHSEYYELADYGTIAPKLASGAIVLGHYRAEYADVT